MKQLVDVDYKNELFKIIYFTGMVTDSQKSRDSHVYGRIDTSEYSGRTFGNISSYITSNHDFFLIDDLGSEMSFRLRNFDFPLRMGQNLTVFWVVPEGEKEGTYYAAFNHNTKEWHSISDIGLLRGLYFKLFSKFANRRYNKISKTALLVTVGLTFVLGIVLKIISPEMPAIEYYIILFLFLSLVVFAVLPIIIIKVYINVVNFNKFLQDKASECLGIYS
jgi:hypothetical protein